MSQQDKVENHYARSALVDTVLAAVDAAGLAKTGLKPRDLAPLDQFHARGLAATMDLAALVGIDAGTRVLDVGFGIGGLARHLAESFGCTVAGVDLTAEYCRLATALTERTGLVDKVSFQAANALELPFADGSFDVAWTQHVVMNIDDRPKLYGEMYRVLKPGGRIAFYDAVAIAGQTPTFPVPWARDASTSFLWTAEATRTVLEKTGFRMRTWRDASEEAKQFFATRAAPGAPASPLGLHLLMGPDFKTMAGNFGRNVIEGRVGLLMAVGEKA